MIKNKKQILKILIAIIAILAITYILFVPEVQAIEFNPDDWAPESQHTATGATRVEEMGNAILSVVRTIASVISVAVLAILGIKYMVGSVEERAEYQKTMLPYFIGSILVFGITMILNVIITVTEGLV